MRKEISLAACLVALIFALAGSFVGPVRAQAGGEPVLTGVLEDSFVLYQNEKGETVCRVATAAERERAHAPGATHVIYRGAPTRRKVTEYGYDVLEYNSVQDTSGLSLLPSAGLTIVLQGTAQLEANPTAKAAFIIAANRWESVISTPITVTLSVDYGPLFFDPTTPARASPAIPTPSASRSRSPPSAAGSSTTRTRRPPSFSSTTRCPRAPSRPSSTARPSTSRTSSSTRRRRAPSASTSPPAPTRRSASTRTSATAGSSTSTLRTASPPA